MAEHTPGPWKNNGGQIEGPDYRRVVATVGTVNDQSQQDTANARLIAAAPALLEALDQCEGAMDTLNGDTGTKSRPCSFCRADVYDGQVGIVHREDCDILAARQALAQARAEVAHA